MLINDTHDYDYTLLIKNDASITKREIRRAIHKATLNKTSRFNEITNRALRHLISVALAQVRFLFAKCIKKKIQSTHFKRVATIVLRKLDKKNYSKLFAFKLIALLDTLKKALKSIISKRLRYVVEEAKSLLDTQMRARRQKLMNTTLQLITKKIHTI